MIGSLSTGKEDKMGDDSCMTSCALETSKESSFSVLGALTCRYTWRSNLVETTMLCCCFICLAKEVERTMLKKETSSVGIP
jgi:hypothetical protein